MLDPATATLAMGSVAIATTVAKAALVLAAGGPRFALRVAPTLLVTAAVGGLALWLRA